MVLATLWSLEDEKKATKLNKAAQITALTGDKTRVDTTVKDGVGGIVETR